MILIHRIRMLKFKYFFKTWMDKIFNNKTIIKRQYCLWIIISISLIAFSLELFRLLCGIDLEIYSFPLSFALI